jgi:hypothetical protein
MVIMVTSNIHTNETEDDTRFKENLRSQLQEREARSSAWYKYEADREKGQRDAEELEAAMSVPFARTALIWIGGLLGTFVFTIGLFWFLSFLGLVLPWNVVFSVLMMRVGGAFIVAAATRGKRR